MHHMPDYVGCFNGTGVPMIITSYDSMTITLCVEVCRTLNKTFAFLGSTSCGCDSDYAIYNRKYGQCQEPCSGQTMSVCGGTGSLMSVYDTSNLLNFKQMSFILNITLSIKTNVYAACLWLF